MKVKRLLTGVMSAFALMGAVFLLTGNTASALAPSAAPTPANLDKAKAAALNFNRQQFHATGVQTFFDTNITNPPQLNQYFILEEDLKDENGNTIGSDHIECRVVGFTATTLKFFCTGTITLTGGTMNIFVQFDAPFDPAAYPITYNAYILGGTGAYSLAFGTIGVTDFGPGNDTEYDFDFIVL